MYDLQFFMIGCVFEIFSVGNEIRFSSFDKPASSESFRNISDRIQIMFVFDRKVRIKPGFFQKLFLLFFDFFIKACVGPPAENFEDFFNRKAE